jgi:hypothetical protein
MQSLSQTVCFRTPLRGYLNSITFALSRFMATVSTRQCRERLPTAVGSQSVQNGGGNSIVAGRDTTVTRFPPLRWPVEAGTEEGHGEGEYRLRLATTQVTTRCRTRAGTTSTKRTGILARYAGKADRQPRRSEIGGSGAPEHPPGVSRTRRTRSRRMRNAIGSSGQTAAHDPPIRVPSRRRHGCGQHREFDHRKLEKTINARGRDPVSVEKAINCGSVSHERFQVKTPRC